ncbi:MAG TPA: division/cell wall cluster transcriptional repressor MraZ [Gammaproteobacteria bacterium]|nr:division/cell wall cluster transcriptional repressor MraZ [Gammaproteobacteria bacterium]
MFRGASKVSLDAKGRLAIPSRYRDRIMARGEGHLVATADLDRCLLIYPLPDWEEIEQELVDLRGLDKPIRELKRLMVGYATELDMDGHGRILVPRELRDFAALDRQVMLIGQGKKFELWDEERWNVRRDEWLAAQERERGELPEALASLSL